MTRKIRWRAITPRWAHLPLSGDGAALVGGRFNAVGRQAIYLSETVETAIAEYEQALVYRPGVFCAYAMSGGRIADLVTDVSLAGGINIATNWQASWDKYQVRPPTWDLADRLRDEGYHGIRMPSFRFHPGVNIVLWAWNETDAPKLIAFDPNRDLPLDPSSWSKRRKVR